MKKRSIVLSCAFLAVLRAAMLGDAGGSAGAPAQDNVIHFTKPTEGQQFPIGSKIVIAWDKNSVSASTLLLCLHKAETGEEISGTFPVSNTGYFDQWEVTADDELGKYYFRLSNYGHTKSGRSATFEFVPGVILVTKPAAGQVLTVNAPASIEWDKNALNAFKYYALVYLQVFSIKLQEAGGDFPVGNTGVYSWTPKSYDIGQNRILVRTPDGKFKGESGIFTISIRIPQKAFKKKV